MRITITTLLLIFSFFSYGRDNNLEGKTLFSTSIGLGYGKKEGIIFHAKPRLIKFILPRFALGIDSEYYTEKKYSRSGIGPSIDLYFLNLGNLDFVLGQNTLYAKESTQHAGIIGTTSLSMNYSLSKDFILGLVFGKMYYLTSKNTNPKYPNFINLAFIFMF